MDNKKSSISGMDAKVVVLICYLGALILSFFNELKFLAWLLPLAIYIIEKDSEFVKKHSAQATILFAIYAVFSIIYAGLFMILFPNTNIFSVNLANFAGSLVLLSTLNMISFLVWIIVAIFAIISASKTWKYEEYDIPVIKNYVEKFRRRIDKFLEDNKDVNSSVNNVNNTNENVSNVVDSTISSNENLGTNEINKKEDEK